MRWLRNPRSHGSSHYVVSKRGEIVQLVSTTDVAWRAGNRRTNLRSIGIEHEGRLRRGGFTRAQYDASAASSPTSRTATESRSTGAM